MDSLSKVHKKKNNFTLKSCQTTNSHAFKNISDNFAEFDLLTAAISDAENVNSGGKLDFNLDFSL